MEAVLADVIDYHQDTEWDPVAGVYVFKDPVDSDDNPIVTGYDGAIQHMNANAAMAAGVGSFYLYLMEPIGKMGEFCPSEREGIRDVKWFTPDEACEAVTHTSLVPMMRRARDMIQRRY